MNNNENQNESLNSISLGNVNSNIENMSVPNITPVDQINQNVQPVEPVAPVQNVVENLNINGESTNIVSSVDTIPPINNEQQINSVSPINSVPPIDNIPPINNIPPIQSGNFGSSDQVNQNQIFNNIGTVPPINDNNGNEKKKGFNKTLFVIIIILVLAAVAVGVYIMLHMGQKNNNVPTVTLKDVTIEAGSKISSEITDYAILNNISVQSCTLDISKITDTKQVNEVYEFKVICNKKEYVGKAKIVDTTVPVVKVKDQAVMVAQNGSVEPSSFIESCDDASTCTYKYKSEDEFKAAIAAVGTHNITIVVSDESGNEIEVTGTMEVSSSLASIYLICSKEGTDYKLINNLGIQDGAWNKTDIRKYEFTNVSASEYESLKNSAVNNQITYKDITGTYSYNSDNSTLTIMKTLTYEELNTETGKTMETSIGGLRSYYTGNGYSCSMGYMN